MAVTSGIFLLTSLYFIQCQRIFKAATGTDLNLFSTGMNDPWNNCRQNVNKHIMQEKPSVFLKDLTY